jgi:hypothetical protein
MKTNIVRLIAAFSLLLNIGLAANQAQAEENAAKSTVANMLLYIQPVEYTNSINVMNYFSQDYWFEQGPVVEPLALKQFNAAFSPVTMCEAGRSAKMIVWLQPRMFYNPQLQMFHGQITANVYTGKGELKTSYVGKSKVHGFVDIKPEKWIEKSYEQAISKVVNKIKADKDLQQLMGANDQSATMDGVSCGIVSSFPIPKVRALSF